MRENIVIVCKKIFCIAENAVLLINTDHVRQWLLLLRLRRVLRRMNLPLLVWVLLVRLMRRHALL
jgi:hypothetical protein